MLRTRGRRAAVVFLAALLVAVPSDAVVHDLTFRYLVSHEVRLLGNGVTHLGTAWAGAGLLGALAVVGVRTADFGLLRASLGGLVGIVLGSTAGHIVKQATCRARPVLFDGWGVGPVVSIHGAAGGRAATLGFFHWPCLVESRYHSFPSGHATTAFTVATALGAAVPGRRRVWLGVAASVGVSRVLLNAHFLSDVLGGAILGWWSGQVGLSLADRFVPRIARFAPLGIRLAAGGEAEVPLQ